MLIETIFEDGEQIYRQFSGNNTSMVYKTKIMGALFHEQNSLLKKKIMNSFSM